MGTGFKKYLGKVSLTLKLIWDILFPKYVGNASLPPTWKFDTGCIVPKRCGKRPLPLAHTPVHMCIHILMHMDASIT